jgi:hypothetical protein
MKQDSCQVGAGFDLSHTSHCSDYRINEKQHNIMTAPAFNWMAKFVICQVARVTLLLIAVTQKTDTNTELVPCYGRDQKRENNVLPFFFFFFLFFFLSYKIVNIVSFHLFTTLKFDRSNVSMNFMP